eukprot:6467846-Amphidinium_carterae.1
MLEPLPGLREVGGHWLLAVACRRRHKTSRSGHHLASVAERPKAEVVGFATWAVPPNPILSGPFLGSHRSRCLRGTAPSRRPSPLGQGNSHRLASFE